MPVFNAIYAVLGAEGSYFTVQYAAL